MNKNYKGIIFDLDGTLANTIEDLVDSLNEMLESHNLPTVTYAQGQSYVGNGLRKLIQRAVPEDLKTDDAFLNRALEEMKALYSKRWIHKTRPYPGVEAFLKLCQDRHIKLGVSSNKTDDATKYIIRALFPDISFIEVIGNVAGKPRKPNPEQTDRIIRKMELKPEEILYIGDSITDVRTAENSHLDVVMVDYGYEDQRVLDELGVKKINNLMNLVDNNVLISCTNNF